MRAVSHLARLALSGLLAATFVAGLLAGPAAGATTRHMTAPELDLKAAYLLSFVRFVRQSDAPAVPSTTPIAIAVVGDEDLSRALRSTVAGKHVDGRSIAVVAVGEPDSLGAGFDLVFVGYGSARHVTRVLERVRGTSALTVGESDDFVERGGIVGLYFEDRKLRFVINAAAADAAGLRISSNLLALAADVRGRRH